MEDTHRPADRPRRYDDFRLSDVAEGVSTFNGTDVPVQFVFDYLGEMHNLCAFLDDFTEVGLAEAIVAIRVYVKSAIPVHSDPGMCEWYAGLQGIEGPDVVPARPSGGGWHGR